MAFKYEALFDEVMGDRPEIDVPATDSMDTGSRYKTCSPHIANELSGSDF